MPWSNFHSHTHYSDGSDAPAAYLQEAVRQGLYAYGFTCHAPTPFDLPWCMKKEAFGSYLSEITRLKTAFKGSLEVLCGLEVDYIPGKAYKTSVADYLPSLDYTIGSVHFVGFFANGLPWDIDGTSDGFANGLDSIWKNDARKAVEMYFGLLREMVLETGPSVIGHMDKIRMHNAQNRYFPEEAPWYRKQVTDTLEAFCSTGAIMEVNTRGIYRGRFSEPYPAYWILELAGEMKIPLVLSSDAHKPHEITGKFAETAEMLLSLGITELCNYEQHTWVPRRFNTQGFLF